MVHYGDYDGIVTTCVCVSSQEHEYISQFVIKSSQLQCVHSLKKSIRMGHGHLCVILSMVVL